jgi:hypothetical protein
MLVDPAISRMKFEREIAEFRKLEDDYISRGWWMLKAEFPEVFVVFAVSKVKPPSVAFGALLDFTNYDLWSPSVKLVDPFTCKPYSWAELPTRLPRLVQPQIDPALVAQFAGQNIQVEAEAQFALLMQSHEPNNPNAVPFLCMPGVREYHAHPGHSADEWLLHRGKGEGTLLFILDKLHQYGVLPITGYQLQLKIHVNGFQFGDVRP